MELILFGAHLWIPAINLVFYFTVYQTMFILKIVRNKTRAPSEQIPLSKNDKINVIQVTKFNFIMNVYKKICFNI